MKRYALALLGAFSLSACAQSASEVDDGNATTAVAAAASAGQAAALNAPTGSPAANARNAILSINPRVVIESIADAPLPGFQEVIVAGQVLYVSDDGRYVMQGSLFDAQEKRDLGQAGLAQLRRTLLAEVPEEQRIVFAPEDPLYTVAVFTDVECGYCRRLHDDIAEYNRRGIAIEYLAYPRMGPDTDDFRLMESVWCADDRRKALTDAKSGRRVPPKTCDNPVAAHYALGQRVGLTGTPMIVAEDGTQMPGYMPPDQLLAALQRLATEAEAGGETR
ncbi:DsbC family protein [Luteimonas sp. BDR2-5]|uniref:DsbC family protein n=1 Tax=Proluteimonas luteida TaxID=2878685 RepID=UPI001E47813D|nr:DsbC family protein [Luteimonas sp. BDR2-5]MCD9027386.1 DsbC family protein [Luteimonas sp. BDR2-5]